MFSLLPPQHQSRLPIYPMHALVVHSFSASPQQHLQPPIAKARLLPRQLHQPANPALADHVPYPQPARVRPLIYELHPFFAITAFSISLSRLRSTTSFFNFVFSSRNCLASCASLTSIPPYFAFQA